MDTENSLRPQKRPDPLDSDDNPAYHADTHPRRRYTLDIKSRIGQIVAFLKVEEERISSTDDVQCLTANLELLNLCTWDYALLRINDALDKRKLFQWSELAIQNLEQLVKDCLSPKMNNDEATTIDGSKTEIHPKIGEIEAEVLADPEWPPDHGMSNKQCRRRHYLQHAFAALVRSQCQGLGYFKLVVQIIQMAIGEHIVLTTEDGKRSVELTKLTKLTKDDMVDAEAWKALMFEYAVRAVILSAERVARLFDGQSIAVLGTRILWSSFKTG